ncbi:non-specific lipid transfer protein GPI-anchored 14-like isoform X1 [Actinidia eriantha]|uniref:non-specific lipid transfer protein GPI-anchored 14-like isoform X1 n=1 Tax=Actinidia eriantha TaxID=165200 RepID=UPI00258F64F8|nr:non-specific lipid transfer protein GPI-anchored 14-like isoform X1 [Actinidia eriantha]
MDEHFTRVQLPLIFLTISMILSCASSDPAKDRKECTEQLVGLATCLPYVGGNAKAPTPDCCSGLKQVLKTNKKCLCVIIRDRNDPELGLTINVTLALGLPSVCNAPANVSQCPALLQMPPNSPDAQIFYQFGHAASSSPTSSPAATGKANATSGPEKSGGRDLSGHRWLGWEVIACGLSIWVFISRFLFM